MGFEDYGLLIDPTKPVLGPGAPKLVFVYRDFVDEIEFSDPQTELLPRYERERRECGGRYVQRKRRHYAPEFGGTARLEKDASRAFNEMKARGPVATMDLKGAPRALLAAGWM